MPSLLTPTPPLISGLIEEVAMKGDGSPLRCCLLWVFFELDVAFLPVRIMFHTS